MRSWRHFRLATHVLQGVLTIALCYPLCSAHVHRRLRQRWSRRLLGIVGVEVRIDGHAVTPGALLVSNHISWLDIYAINTLTPSAFVSKAEVRDWPVIGWLAAKSETVFLRRGSRGHARIVNGEITALLDAGRNVAIFPEGTTTDGSHVLPFHAALLQAAIESGHPVQPVALSYHTEDGRHTTAAAYDGDISLGRCLANIVSHRRLVVRVHVASARATGPATLRRELAHATRDTIAELASRPLSAFAPATAVAAGCQAASQQRDAG